MCERRIGNPFVGRTSLSAPQAFADLRLLQAYPRRRMLITLAQGIVRSGYEHLPPLQQCRRQEAGDGAKDDFLEKGRVHEPLLPSKSSAPALTKIPIGASA